jgi:hypothetical protein
MQTTLKVGEADVAVEYSLAPQLVVFSHGFGVSKDSRGLFPSIAQSLPRGWGYAMFDYDTFDAATNQARVTPMSERIERLKAVLDWAHQQPGVAPPLVMGSRFEEIYTKRDGAKHDGHTWLLPRSDGSTTVVDDQPFADIVSIDAEGELTKLAMFRPYSLILASVDEILPDADYTDLLVLPSVNGMGIDGADHNFGGASRAELIELVNAQLQAKPTA